MVSTPNAPGGLFQKIEQEPFDTCIYKKKFLDYTWGLDRIYIKSEIEKAKQSPSFPREYELQYLGLIGNVFSQLSIDNNTKIQYNPGNIAVLDDVNKDISSTLYKQQKLPAAYAALEKAGFKFKSYEER